MSGEGWAEWGRGAEVHHLERNRVRSWRDADPVPAARVLEATAEAGSALIAAAIGKGASITRGACTVCGRSTTFPDVCPRCQTPEQRRTMFTRPPAGSMAELLELHRTWARERRRWWRRAVRLFVHGSSS